jgi:AcrR family transcriptional regulator
MSIVGRDHDVKGEGESVMVTPTAPGRAAQRRRTRRAIVDATMSLLATGEEPSVNDIAVAADVSRRTVYLHYPTLDQLILDAAVGLLNVDVDAALAAVESTDPFERLATLIAAVYNNLESSLGLGRKIIKLTVDLPPVAADEPRRGHRRIGWIEWVVEPLRDQLSPAELDDLVSCLALVIGWESFIVLLDVRGLSPEQAQELTRHAATVLLQAAVPSGSTRVRRKR